MILTLVFFRIGILVYLFNSKFTNTLLVSGGVVAETMFLAITFLLLVNPLYIIYKLEQIYVTAGLRFIKNPYIENSSNNTYKHKEKLCGGFAAVTRKPFFSSLHSATSLIRAKRSISFGLEGNKLSRPKVLCGAPLRVNNKNFFNYISSLGGEALGGIIPLTKLRYSTGYLNNSTKDSYNQDKLKSLNPFWVTGLIDGEGSFSISVVKRPDRKTGWHIQPSFSIELHKKDLSILLSLLSFFSVGNIRTRSQNGQSIYSVNSVEELNRVIIPFFDKYPLLTKKRADFILFKQAVVIMNNKQHLTLDGLSKIIEIRASMNNGLSKTLSDNFSNIIPMVRPSVELNGTVNPYWLAGFTNAEGCFYIIISKSKTNIGYTVQLKFVLTQHSRDKQLMEYIGIYLGCGRYEARSKGILAGSLVVSKLSDLSGKIIPFFDKYPILGNKRKDYADFKRAIELLMKKAHLTVEGLAEIRKIKEGMNTGRDD